jgi:hypothetical protein
MKTYDNLELRILSCLMIKPDLMDKVIVEDKHFKIYKRLWLFMKAFYKKFETFDCELMYSVCKDKYQIINYLEFLMDLEPSTRNFNKYQKLLIEQYEESERDKMIIEKVYEWANELYVRNISVEHFKELVDRLYKEIK